MDFKGVIKYVFGYTKVLFMHLKPFLSLKKTVFIEKILKKYKTHK
ncbi:hypothetical protein SAMN05444397_101882 [Flavobacterium aquidurense]|nr:hypothetical protein SAMN05444397_101882 [Flavobacterium aquidurense]